jgi:hypothetical protein
VTIWGEIVLNGSGNTLAANPLSIITLPFTPAATPGAIFLFPGYSNLGGNFVQLTIRINGSSTTMPVGGSAAAAATNTLAQNANAVLSTTLGSAIRFSGQYRV